MSGLLTQTEYPPTLSVNKEKQEEFGFDPTWTYFPRPGKKEDIPLGLYSHMLSDTVESKQRQIYTVLDLMGDVGGLFESLLLIAAVIMKIFGTNFLDLYII